MRRRSLSLSLVHKEMREKIISTGMALFIFVKYILPLFLSYIRKRKKNKMLLLSYFRPCGDENEQGLARVASFIKQWYYQSKIWFLSFIHLRLNHEKEKKTQ